MEFFFILPMAFVIGLLIANMMDAPTTSTLKRSLEGLEKRGSKFDYRLDRIAELQRYTSALQMNFAMGMSVDEAVKASDPTGTARRYYNEIHGEMQQDPERRAQVDHQAQLLARISERER